MPGDGVQNIALPGDGARGKVMPGKVRLTREQIAQRAALELPDGAYVNLGWGIPNLIADYLPKEITVYFHSENGIRGMGPRGKTGEGDFDQVDAMKVPVTLIPGASFFHQADAHLMTRGGHIDVAVLGGFQVSEKGDLANWKISGAKGSGGIGGAMDIAAGAKTLIVCMEHTTRDGAPKIVKHCTYPLTALACVDTIVTDLAVIDVKPEGLILREVARGWSAEEVQSLTGAPLIARQQVPEMSFALFNKEGNMSQVIPESHADLLEKQAFGNLGTLMKDGSRQVTPVWVDYDGKFVRFNSAKGRVKDKNIRRDPRDSIALQDPANPYRYLEIRGRVVEITETGADEHINKLSQKYLGKPVYPYRQPGDVRVTYKIEPEKVSFMG